ncbi:uncharacterized protein [Rutidosis leptorrhynchoides]|uniref:uncharacterized protein isoform X2 n=1 Tax=Rutidosis leptorrhynchoides TaxID=125765 RepID=UPI003A98D402
MSSIDRISKRSCYTSTLFKECAHRARPVTRANFKDSVSTSGLDPKVHYTLDARSHDNDLYTALKPAINPIQLLIIYLLMRYACKNIDPILS